MRIEGDVTVGDLLPGDTFAFSNRFYLRLNERTPEHLVLCADIRNGRVSSFPEDMGIAPVQGKFVV